MTEVLPAWELQGPSKHPQQHPPWPAAQPQEPGPSRAPLGRASSRAPGAGSGMTTPAPQAGGKHSGSLAAAPQTGCELPVLASSPRSQDTPAAPTRSGTTLISPEWNTERLVAALTRTCRQHGLGTECRNKMKGKQKKKKKRKRRKIGYTPEFSE